MAPQPCANNRGAQRPDQPALISCATNWYYRAQARGETGWSDNAAARASPGRPLLRGRLPRLMFDMVRSLSNDTSGTDTSTVKRGDARSVVVAPEEDGPNSPNGAEPLWGFWRDVSVAQAKRLAAARIDAADERSKGGSSSPSTKDRVGDLDHCDGARAPRAVPSQPSRSRGCDVFGCCVRSFDDQRSHHDQRSVC